MIEFYSTNEFILTNPESIRKWIYAIIADEGYKVGEVQYIFCNDDYLLSLNVEFLSHDTLTDIISFDYRIGKEINGEIYISTQRVEENAELFNVPFNVELQRVMIHGILHFCGFKDKTVKENINMRRKEDEALQKLSQMI